MIDGMSNCIFVCLKCLVYISKKFLVHAAYRLTISHIIQILLCLEWRWPYICIWYEWWLIEKCIWISTMDFQWAIDGFKGDKRGSKSDQNNSLTAFTTALYSTSLQLEATKHFHFSNPPKFCNKIQQPIVDSWQSEFAPSASNYMPRSKKIKEKKKNVRSAYNKHLTIREIFKRDTSVQTLLRSMFRKSCQVGHKSWTY